jgi:hypothetical protein
LNATFEVRVWLVISTPPPPPPPLFPLAYYHCKLFGHSSLQSTAVYNYISYILHFFLPPNLGSWRYNGWWHFLLSKVRFYVHFVSRVSPLMFSPYSNYTVNIYCMWLWITIKCELQLIIYVFIYHQERYRSGWVQVTNMYGLF